jgi:hypothetical protein
MTQFKGFETEEEAKKFSKVHGGVVCGKESKQKYKREDWNLAVVCGGLDAEKYPWCVQWNLSSDHQKEST